MSGTVGKIKMTREEFLEGLAEMVKDIENPKGDFANMIGEGQEMIDAAAEFDPELGKKIENIVFAFSDLASYAKTMQDIDGKNLKK